MVTPFDGLFHFTFQLARHAARWLRSVLPPPTVDAIDWDTLEPAPEKLRGRTLRLSITDVVFEARQRANGALVRILAEHKAQRDPGVGDQLLRYSVLLRERGAGRGPPVPVVVVLLHHGDRPFVAIDDSQDPFAAMQPRQPMVVDDLSQVAEADILRRDLTPLGTLALLCLRFLRGMSGDEALAALERWGEQLRAVDRDEGPPEGATAVGAIACYTLMVVEVPHRTLHTTFERLLQRPEETIMSTAEKLRREGLEEGLAKGLAKGLATGEAKGRAEIVLRLLTRRFGSLPPTVTQRVGAAAIGELDRWAERLLDAASLDDVFADS